MRRLCCSSAQEKSRSLRRVSSQLHYYQTRGCPVPERKTSKETSMSICNCIIFHSNSLLFAASTVPAFNIFASFFKHLGRENQNSKMIALPHQYSGKYFQKYCFEKGILEITIWSMTKITTLS